MTYPININICSEELKKIIQEATQHHSQVKQQALETMRQRRKPYLGTAFLNLNKNPAELQREWRDE